MLKKKKVLWRDEGEEVIVNHLDRFERYKCARSGHKFVMPYCKAQNKLLTSVHTSIPYIDNIFTYCETGTIQTQSCN